MSDSRVVLSEAAIVARLRAAGCVFAEDEARLLLSTVADPADLAKNVNRRVSGVPLEHILGWVEFAGLRVAVSPGIFVPRRRTEFLVRQAAAHTAPGAVVLDLCCGCGALAMALNEVVAGVQLYAADIEPAAVACARINLASLGGKVFAGDLFQALPRTLQGSIDTILCNAPYVPTEEIGTMPPEARVHESPTSLDGGFDGLEVHRQVATDVARWLAPGGRIFIEASRDQAEGTAALLSQHGLVTRIVSSAEFFATVVIGMAPVHSPPLPGDTEGRTA